MSDRPIADQKEATAPLDELWCLANEIALDIERVRRQSHPSKLHYLGIAAAVRELCQEFSQGHKIEVERSRTCRLISVKAPQ